MTNGKESKRESVREDINNAFFGSQASTGWHSVKSFYAEESRNRFALSGVTTKWFDCGLSYEAFKSSNESTTQLISVATQWIKNTYEFDWEEFDYDCDGYFDVFVLVYAAPDYNTTRSWSDTNLWAYCSWTMQKPNLEIPNVNEFMWASYDFMYGRNISRGKTGHDYGSGHTQITPIDTHTFIHEFGHLLGLSDYYDYSGQYSPGGAFSMQDNNVGAHDPFSKMALNWIEPYVPTETITLSIKPVEAEGDVILLSPEYTGSTFDEYITIKAYNNYDRC